MIFSVDSFTYMERVTNIMPPAGISTHNLPMHTNRSFLESQNSVTYKCMHVRCQLIFA